MRSIALQSMSGSVLVSVVRVASAIGIAVGAAACDGDLPVTEGGSSGAQTGSDDGETSGPSGTSSTSGDSESDDDGGATTGASDDTAGETSSEPETIEVHTELTEDGRLALRTDLPPEVAACEALGSDASCADEDADGLVDAWEDAVLDRMRPLRRLDEDEGFLTDPTAAAADVGRVTRVQSGNFRVFVMLGWSNDYGTCGGFTGHHGDSERVALDLAPWPQGGAGGVIVARAYTAAHEGAPNDHSHLYDTDELGVLVHDADPMTGEPRWVVFSSENKHATYANLEICEDVYFIPFACTEDCAPDDVANPGEYDLLPVFVNAGEDDARRADDLTEVGFPGETAWGEQRFCGGLGGSGCATAVRPKLLEDPFGA